MSKQYGKKAQSQVSIEETLGQMLELLQTIADSVDHEKQVKSGGALSREQPSSFLGISPRLLHDLVVEGKIRRVAISPGRHVFRKQELDRFLFEHEETLVDHAEEEVRRIFN